MVLEGGFKRCSGCGVTLPIGLFHRHWGNLDGYQSCCKSCSKASVGAHRARNRARHLARRGVLHGDV